MPIDRRSWYDEAHLVVRAPDFLEHAGEVGKDFLEGRRQGFTFGQDGAELTTAELRYRVLVEHFVPEWMASRMVSQACFL